MSSTGTLVPFGEPPSSGVASGDLVGVAAVRRAAHASKADNTWAAYESAWFRFVTWCGQHGLSALPADPMTVCLYLTGAAEPGPDDARRYRVSTLDVWLTAISQAHHLAGFPKLRDDPQIQTVMAGLRRSDPRPATRADPLLEADIVAMVNAMDFTHWPAALAAARDAALLLVGFAGAFRRSELASLQLGQVSSLPEGARIMLPVTKTSQDGAEPAVKAIPFGRHPATCPMCALRRWIDLVNIVDTQGRPDAVQAGHVWRDVAAALAEPDPGKTGQVRMLLMRQVQRRQVERHVCRDPLPIAVDDPRPLLRSIPRAGHHVAAWSSARPARAGLTGKSVHLIVQRRAAAAGVPAHNVSGHSLRAGFVTQAVLNGADSLTIRRQTGHKTDQMIDLYTRTHDPFTANAVTSLGL